MPDDEASGEQQDDVLNVGGARYISVVRSIDSYICVC